MERSRVAGRLHQGNHGAVRWAFLDERHHAEEGHLGPALRVALEEQLAAAIGALDGHQGVARPVPGSALGPADPAVHAPAVGFGGPIAVWEAIVRDFSNITEPAAFSAFVQVLMIDLVLAGDNAIVVGALAAGLLADQRRKVIILGVVAALVLRIIFALIVTQLLQIIGLILVGGILLLWVAWKMWRELHHGGESAGSPEVEGDEHSGIRPAKSFAAAAWAVALMNIALLKRITGLPEIGNHLNYETFKPPEDHGSVTCLTCFKVEHWLRIPLIWFEIHFRAAWGDFAAPGGRAVRQADVRNGISAASVAAGFSSGRK